MRHAFIAVVIVATLALLAGGAHLLQRPPSTPQTTAEQTPVIEVTPRTSRFGSYWSEVFVIDLGQPGINLYAPRAANATFFDMDNDGFAELSGWVAPDDGILAIDLDGDGRITNYSELLAGGDKSGFGALSWLDSDRNGSIDQFDRDYHRLYVWRDLNGDGLSSPNELIALARSNVRIVPLRGRSVNETLAQQQVVARGSVYVSGAERDMIAVRMVYDNAVSRDDRPLGAFDTTIRTLPELRGYGRLPGLQRAMNSDNALRILVEKLKATAISELLDDAVPVTNLTRDILYRWARVEDIALNARGMDDSRMLAWLEVYRDEPYRQGGPSGVSNPTPDMYPRLEGAFARAHQGMTAKLLVQTQLGALFTGLRYNPARDVLEGYRGLDPQRLNQVKWVASQSQDPAAVWRVVMLIVHAMGEQAMGSADRALLVTAIGATAPKTSFEALLAEIRARENTGGAPASASPAAPAVAPAAAVPTTAPAVTPAATPAVGGGGRIQRVGSGG